MIEIIPNWHPIFVHFTVALLTVAALLTVVAVPMSAGSSLRAQMEVAARWNLWLGLGFAIATVFAGWIAYSTVEHDDVSHLAMRGHRNFAMTTLSIYLAVFFWSVTRAWTGKRPNAAFALLLLLATGLLGATAYRGGELVYRYGLGVMSLPNPAGHAHALANKDAAAEPGHPHQHEESTAAGSRPDHPQGGHDHPDDSDAPAHEHGHP